MQPEISICLASFNGEKYIREQIASILVQMGEFDQLIVCDDNSTDSTCEVILSFNDPRIELIKNQINLGHVKNFEKALSFAKGKYIFLADQDNIWEPDKVEKTLLVFNKHKRVVLVVHSMNIVNEHGISIRDNKIPFKLRGPQNSIHFLFRQIIKPDVFGCACCFDGCLLKSLIQFPAAVYAHDHWIAAASAVQGNIYYLDNNLIKYRLHESNLTPKNSPSLFIALVYRFKYILLVISLCFRRFCIHI